MADAAHLARYYAERAGEYEAVYHKPERQADIARLGERLRQLLSGHDVLEIACGTGYWTAKFASSAKTIVATDINQEVLRLAHQKQLSPDRVRFLQADAYALDGVRGAFTAGFAGFWLSHVLKHERSRFLDTFHARLQSGATGVLVDNLYVEGSNHPISRVDAAGNMYQQRCLENGTRFEVLKNFPGEEELRDMLGERAHTIRYQQLTYYWLLVYTTA